MDAVNFDEQGNVKSLDKKIFFAQLKKFLLFSISAIFLLGVFPNLSNDKIFVTQFILLAFSFIGFFFVAYNIVTSSFSIIGNLLVFYSSKINFKFPKLNFFKSKKQ